MRRKARNAVKKNNLCTIYGLRCYLLREALNWSQERLAQEANLSLECIEDLESGKTRKPFISTIEAIAEVFQVDVNYMVGWD